MSSILISGTKRAMKPDVPDSETDFLPPPFLIVFCVKEIVPVWSGKGKLPLILKIVPSVRICCASNFPFSLVLPFKFSNICSSFSPIRRSPFIVPSIDTSKFDFIFSAPKREKEIALYFPSYFDICANKIKGTNSRNVMEINFFMNFL